MRKLQWIILCLALLLPPGLTATTQEAEAFAAGHANLAENQTYSSSSAWSGSFTASYAFDSNETTRWSSASGQSEDQWVQVQFDERQAVNRVVIREYSSRITSFRVEYSEDGLSYSTAASGEAVGSRASIRFPVVYANFMRLYIESASAEPSLYELEVYYDTNLDRGKTYRSSTSWSSTYSAERAFDANPNSRWSAASGSDAGEWLEVDLQQEQWINRVELQEAYSRIQSYEILVSSDGVSYSAIQDGAGATIGEQRTILFSPIRARYVRLHVLEATAEPSIVEMSVYYELNTALHRIYAASSAWNASFAADKAFDGADATRWSAASGQTANQWLTIDFGEQTTYHKVLLREYGSRIASFRLQSSNDGFAFSDIEGTGGTKIGAARTILFHPTESRYLRLFIESSNSEPSIYEMSVYDQVSSLTDEAFFGIWDAVAGQWTAEPKLDYGAFVELADTELCVQAGDYTCAREALLNYYQGRNGPISNSEITTNSRDEATAALLMEDIYTPMTSEVYVTGFMASSSYDTYSLDVVEAVAAMGIDRNITFILMARNKDNRNAQFHSREAGSNQPVLSVKVGATIMNLQPIKDTYIRAGQWGTTNYGSASLLEVKDDGQPVNGNNRKSYLQFDLSGIDGEIEEAELSLYGWSGSGTGSKEMMLYRSTNNGWQENTLNWNNHFGNTFSWKDAPGGLDWIRPDGAGNEYINHLTWFRFLNPLVAEYLATETETFAEKAIYSMVHFIDATDSSGSLLGAGSYNRSLDTGLRAAKWTDAFRQLTASPSMDADALTEIIKTFWKKGAYLSLEQAYHPDNNWGLNETLGFYRVGVIFPEFKLSEQWRSLAKSRFESMSVSLNFEDGGYTEASTGYNASVIQGFISSKELGLQIGDVFGTLFDDQVIDMVEFVVNTNTPDGKTPALGDSNAEDQAELIYRAGVLYNRDDFLYIGSGGLEGSAPSYTSVEYPLYGGAITRSGWEPGDLYMFINSGSQLGNHRHHDDNAVIVHGYGQPLLVDTGTYTYSGEAASVWQRTRPESHNTITINGESQNLNGGTIDLWADNGSFNYLRSSTFSTPGFSYYRSVLFVKPNYWIVSDWIDAPVGTHEYEQNWHFLPSANPVLDPITKVAATSFGADANIAVIPADPESLTASLNPGYFSETFNSVAETSFGSYYKEGSGNMTFDTVLMPLRPLESRKAVVERLTLDPLAAPSTATALRIELDAEGTGHIGYYYLTHEPVSFQTREFDGFGYNGRLAYIERDHDGELVRAFVGDGSELKDGNVDLIASSESIPDMGIEWSGDELIINGSALISDDNPSTAIGIYAPDAVSVTLNGDEGALFTRVGDYIYAAGV